MDDIEAPIFADAHVNGTASVGTTDGSDGAKHQAEYGGTALKPDFLAGLALAMRNAATRERDRISSVVAGDAAAHVEKVRGRAAIETEELRRLAEEDVQHIEQWSASEIERIKGEAAQRVDDRRASLEEYLKQHDSIIETEIERVDAAVRGYGETLDRFFADLGATTEPADIARRAEQLPAPPDLDEVRSEARASAMARLAASEDDVRPAEVTAEIAETIDASGDTVEVTAEAASVEEPVAAVAGVESPETTAEAPVASAAADSGDDGAMIGVMDDGAGSIEPAETMEQPAAEAPAADAPAAEESPAEAPVAAEAATSEPVGVMDQDAMRVPAWPAPAPADGDPARIAPTVDHTSAAVRLLRSVAPWTAPTHAGSRSEGDSE